MFGFCKLIFTKWKRISSPFPLYLLGVLVCLWGFWEVHFWQVSPLLVTLTLPLYVNPGKDIVQFWNFYLENLAFFKQNNISLSSTDISKALGNYLTSSVPFALLAAKAFTVRDSTILPSFLGVISVAPNTLCVRRLVSISAHVMVSESWEVYFLGN